MPIIRQWRLAVLLLGLGLGLTVFLARRHWADQEAARLAVAKLDQGIFQPDRQADAAVAAYRPAIAGRIDDLSIDAASILRQLPGVIRVEVAVSVDKPRQRLIHVRDWPLIPGDRFAAQGRAQPFLSDDQLDLLYDQHLVEVEQVQAEQIVLLRCLASHHGLRAVFAEGLTAADLPAYREEVVRQGALTWQLPLGHPKVLRLQKSHNEQAHRSEAGLRGMLAERRLTLLGLGSPGRLWAAEQIAEVLPLEVDKPRTAEGGLQLEAGEARARAEGRVQTALQQGPLAVLVLGGDQDLTASIRRLCPGACEYLRMTTTQYQELARHD
jgi:hypothetical protein